MRDFKPGDRVRINNRYPVDWEPDEIYRSYHGCTGTVVRKDPRGLLGVKLESHPVWPLDEAFLVYSSELDLIDN
jgi:hypothetical protein